jgi:asparagine synthetase B (glutamine-hydrolysing)
MIGGYISTSQDSHIESVFEFYGKSPQVKKTFRTDKNFVFVFSELTKKSGAHYTDDDSTIVIDGFPVLHDTMGYRRFDTLKDIDGMSLCKFEDCIDTIVSTVNIISVQRTGDHFLLKMASHRGACGRIYYIILPDNKGIIFCSDIRPLCNFTKFSPEPMAYYSIIKYGLAPDPITIIKNIYSIPVSHYGTFNTETYALELSPFFLFEFTESHGCDIQESSGFLQNSAEFLASMGSSILMSGGVDSTLFAHYMQSGDLPSGTRTPAYFLSFGEHDPNNTYGTMAAEKAGADLTTITMESDKVIQTLETCAQSYIHPFSDFSTLPVCYLMNEIRKANTEEIFLIDGLAADACFSVTDQNTLTKLFYSLPFVLQNIARMIFENVRIASPRSILMKKVMVQLAKFREKNIFLCHCAISPYDEVFRPEIRESADELADKMNGLLHSCINFEKSNNVHYAKNTTQEIIHRMRGVGLKSYALCSPFVEVVYPYIWKDILVEQGKLSPECKKNNGINKRPLKTMLENFMPKEFVYRKKTGFRPPLGEWLHDENVAQYCRDIIFNENAFIKTIIPPDILKSTINRFIEHQKDNDTDYHETDYYELSFIWSIVFTELWLVYNQERSHVQCPQKDNK